MTRKKDNGLSKSVSQSKKDIRKQVTAAKNRAKKLLQKHNKDIRAVRSEVAALKKAGIISSRIDARSYQPSAYMLKKIAANRDILEGRAVAVKTPKKIRQKYIEKGMFEERGGALIVPKDRADQRVKIQRGLVAVSRPLAMGEEQRLILPFKATDMEGVAEGLRLDPTLGGMKKPDELFGFRLFGHNMATIGFPDADELADYIQTRYKHLFSGENGRLAVQQFELLKFRSRDSAMKEGPESRKQYSAQERKQGNQWAIDRRKKVAAARKAKLREKETPEQREKRLADQRARSARNRAEKRKD